MVRTCTLVLKNTSLLKTLERQKMSVDSIKRPLMMAALNGLYVARMPVPESPSEEGAKSPTDERVKCFILFFIFVAKKSGQTLK